jgi:hypothetical protein
MKTSIPSQIVSGMTESWIERRRAYPSDEWTLSYHLRGGAAQDVTATATEDKRYEVELTAATGSGPSTPLPVGRYYWQAKVTNIADTDIKKVIDSGHIEVLADLESIDEAYDGRSKAEVMVDAIDAVLAKKATRDQQSFTIGQRTLTRIPPKELIEWRQYYAGIVRADAMKKRIADGGSPFETILAEFAPESRGSHHDDDHDGF